jgi:hypothetical protein
MTRGMLFTVLHRAAGEPPPQGQGEAAGQAAPQSEETIFSDLPEGAYYAEAAVWAAENGILTGTGARRAAPEADISRQDLATVLLRYTNATGRELPAVRSEIVFADAAQTAGYAREAVQALCAAGVVNGRPGNRFDPRGNATRAEIAAMLHRFLEAAE